MRTRQSVKERSIYNRTKQIFSVINFAENELKQIMLMLGQSKYKIGGSVAAYMYGLNLDRVPHDIDVIVPFGIYETLKHQVENSVFFKEETLTSSIDDEWNTKHFCFRTAKSYAIDIIEAPKDDENWGYHIASVKELLEAKKRYNRPKDAKDLVLLEELYGSIYNTQESGNIVNSNNSLGDLDALAELKKKMKES